MSNLSSKYKKLSKFLSYILRHHPEDGDISLDDRGFTDLEEVLEAVKNTKHSWASEDDIRYLIENGDKRRFEIVNGNIRALYGHSVEVEIEEDAKPPVTLYHGTSPESLSSILDEGLKPMGRQFVHLSRSIKEARKVGKRHHPEPVILEIDALSVWEDRTRFYDREEIYLVDYVSPEYIKVLKDETD